MWTVLEDCVILDVFNAVHWSYVTQEAYMDGVLAVSDYQENYIDFVNLKKDALYVIYTEKLTSTSLVCDTASTRRPLIFDKRFRLLLSVWPKVMFIGSSIVTLTVLHIFHIKNCERHPKWSPWVQHRNSCHSWHISRQEVWHWFLAQQGHPRLNPTVPVESTWVLHISARTGPTSYLSLFSRYFKSTDFDVDLWPLWGIQGQIWWCQSKDHTHFPIWPLLNPTPYLSPFGHKSFAWPPNQPTNYPTKDIATKCVTIGPVCNTMYCSLNLK